MRLTRLFASLLLLAATLPALAHNFEGIVTHVSDGDTLSVRPVSGGAPRQVRLQGIDAPEICQAYGAQARDALANRALHQRVRVASKVFDSYQRTLGNVSVNGQDLGVWMVRHGHAWSYRFQRDLGPYAAQETQARQARLGLWREAAPIRPRDFRQRHGSCS